MLPAVENRLLAPSASYECRAYSYSPACGICFGGVLWIHQDSRPADVYAVEELTWAESYNPFIWRLFAVCKASVAREDGLYLVRVPGELNRMAKPSCECFGYNRWQSCKHIAALVDLCRSESEVSP